LAKQKYIETDALPELAIYFEFKRLMNEIPPSTNLYIRILIQTTEDCPGIRRF